MKDRPRILLPQYLWFNPILGLRSLLEAFKELEICLIPTEEESFKFNNPYLKLLFRFERLLYPKLKEEVEIHDLKKILQAELIPYRVEPNRNNHDSTLMNFSMVEQALNSRGLFKRCYISISGNAKRHTTLKRNRLLHQNILQISQRLIFHSISHAKFEIPPPPLERPARFNATDIIAYFMNFIDKSQRFFKKDWELLFRVNEGNWQAIAKEDGTLEADPFLVDHGGKVWCLYELLKHGEDKGEIFVREFVDGQWSKGVCVLREDFHLSYPMIFKHESLWYMIPESAQSGSLRLYKAVEFPYKWILVEESLIQGRFLDATVVQTEVGLKLLVNRYLPGINSGSDDLFMYDMVFRNGSFVLSKDFCHVLSDVRFSRGAGKVVKHGEWYYRYCQNNAKYYGHDLSLLRFKIDEGGIHEISVVKESGIENLPSLMGKHTYAKTANIELIDKMI